MNKSEYDRLRSKIEEAFEDAIREHRDRRDADFAALDRVYELAGDCGHSTSVVLREQEVTQNGRHTAHDDGRLVRGQLQDAILLAIDRIRPADFTFRDVLAAMEEVSPEVAGATDQNAVTQVLRRLAETGPIQIVEQGKGRRATSYQFTEPMNGSDSP